MKKQYAMVLLVGFALLSSAKNFTMDALDDNPQILINFFEERQEYLQEITDQSSNKEQELLESNEYNDDYDNQKDSDNFNENKYSPETNKISYLAKSFCALYVGLVLTIFYYQLY